MKTMYLTVKVEVPEDSDFNGPEINGVLQNIIDSGSDPSTPGGFWYKDLKVIKVMNGFIED